MCGGGAGAIDSQLSGVWLRACAQISIDCDCLRNRIMWLTKEWMPSFNVLMYIYSANDEDDANITITRKQVKLRTRSIIAAYTRYQIDTRVHLRALARTGSILSRFLTSQFHLRAHFNVRGAFEFPWSLPHSSLAWRTTLPWTSIGRACVCVCEQFTMNHLVLTYNSL